MFDAELPSAAPVTTTAPSQISPPPSNSGINGRKMPTWFAIAIFCLLIYLGFSIWAQVRFGSYRYALSYLKGARLQIRPAIKVVGTHRPDESYQTTVTLRNHGDTSVEVLGALTDCSCIAYRGLPVTVKPGASVDMPVEVHFGPQAGVWHQSITYLTDNAHQPRLRAELSGRVLAP
jgi:hypothetical protein